MRHLRGVVILALFCLAGPAWAADAVKEIDDQWAAVERHKLSGDLANLNMTLDLIHQEIGRRVQLGFLSENDGYVRHNRARLAKMRKWLAPQLTFYAKLVSTADALAKESWNLGLFQGGKERFGKYADIKRRLDEAEEPALSFVKAFPKATESPPIKKLRAARGNLAEEKKRALAAWIRQASDQFELAVARNEAVPPAVHIALLQVRALDPENGEMNAIIARLGAYHQKRYEDLSRARKLPRNFPEADQVALASVKDQLKAAFYRQDPMSSIRRFALPEMPAIWIDAKSGAERQSLPTMVGVRSSDGKCELLRVWYYTGRARGAKAYTPFEISGIEKLSPLDCSALE